MSHWFSGFSRKKGFFFHIGSYFLGNNQHKQPIPFQSADRHQVIAGLLHFCRIMKTSTWLLCFCFRSHDNGGGCLDFRYDASVDEHQLEVLFAVIQNFTVNHWLFVRALRWITFTGRKAEEFHVLLSRLLAAGLKSFRTLNSKCQG